MSPNRKQSFEVIQRQLPANRFQRPRVETDIGRHSRKLTAALIHLFWGEKIGVVPTLVDQAVAEAIRRRCQRRLVGLCPSRSMPISAEIAAQERP